MAILNKRKSGRGAPSQQNALNSVVRAPTTNGLSSTPKTALVPRTSMTSSTAPKSNLTSTTTPATSPSFTSTTTLPVNRPNVTVPTSATSATKTTPASTVARPTISKPTASNSATNTIVNALTGAALGAGTKLIVDKLTGKKTVVAATPEEKTAQAEKIATDKETAKRKAKEKNLDSVVKPPLTDEQIQAELDKAKAAEEPIGLPDGAVKNADGTYSVIDGNIKTIYNADGSVAGMESALPDTVSTSDSLGTDESIVTNDKPSVRGIGGTTAKAENNYFDDGAGNIYALNANGEYELLAAKDTYTVGEDGSFTWNDFTNPEEEIIDTPEIVAWTDPDTGETWNLSDSGMWTLEGDDTSVAEEFALNGDSSDSGISFQEANKLPFDPYEDYVEYDANKYGDLAIEDYFGPMKGGGLITMMKKGGGVHMAAGGLGVQTFDDGSYIQTFDDGSTITFDSDGNIFDSTDAPQTTIDDSGNYIVTDDYGNMTVYDPNGNLIPLGGGRANVGSGDKTTAIGNPLQNLMNSVGNGFGNVKDFLGTTAGAAGAGALLASILGNDMGGGTGAQNQGLDMSKVGVINPRTTNFGIGPTRFAGFEDYGTSGGDYTPNAELLKNLNAPGYNPVNEGDYGYDEVPAEETTETPKMSSGGLSSMATPVASYYTFGQPADILANLGMRPPPPMNPPEQAPQIGQQQPPQQAQQQGLPQQMPTQMPQQTPQGMPQQGTMPQQQGMAPPMRKGGLPHISNVPMTQGRMDFRQGSAVHGEGDGQSDDIPAMLADGEYVIDADTVAQIGNGSTKAGAQALDKFREGIRAHKRSAPINKIPPKTKALTSYLKGAR